MACAGTPRNRFKDALVVLAERLVRLKLNGRLFHRARLSDVIELEVLIARARGQREVVSRCHQSASSRAFGRQLGGAGNNGPGSASSDAPLARCGVYDARGPGRHFEHRPRKKENHVSGLHDNVTGKAKEAAGDLTDDKDLQREGKTDQAAGTVKDKLDDAADWAADKVDDVKESVNRR